MNTTNNEKQMDKMFDRLTDQSLSSKEIPACLENHKESKFMYSDVKQSIQEFLKEFKKELPKYAYEEMPVSEISGFIDTLAKQKFGDKILKAEK